MIMKAIYQKPSTEEVFVSVSQLMSASQTPQNVEEGFDPTDTPTTEETSGNLSRRRTVWEDEEEDEEDF